MNIQSGRRGAAVRSSQHRPNSRPALSRRLPAIIKTVIFFAAAAGLFNTYIYLNQRINDSDRAARRAQREIVRVDNEIAQQRIRGEELRAWPHVSSQIRRFGLKLRPASPGQVRRMVLVSPPQAARIRFEDYSRETAVLGSARIR